MEINSYIPSLYKPILDNKHLFYIYYGGRGAGKTENIAQILVLLSITGKYRILCIREMQNSINESVKATLEKWIETLNLGKYFKITAHAIKTITGSDFLFLGMRTHTATNVKSISNINITWVEEAESFSKRSWEVLVPSVIRTPNPRIIVSFNPRYEDDAIYADMIARKPPDNAYVRKVNYDENPFFAGSELEVQMLSDKERLPNSEFAHKWLGELITYSDDSIFRNMDFTPLNLPFERDKYRRVIVACDPATTDKEFSNEYGIIVAGLNYNDEVIIFEDGSANFEPVEFAREVSNLYKYYQANYAVVEVNNGGDFIKAMLLQVDGDIVVKEVRAIYDKVLRASPVSTLCSVGKVKFNKTMPQLERQMRLLTDKGYVGVRGESPDRLDAMVWACYKLFDITNHEAIWQILEPKNIEPDEEYLKNTFVIARDITYCFFDGLYYNYVNFDIYKNVGDYRLCILESWRADKFAPKGMTFLNDTPATANYDANFYTQNKNISSVLIQECVPYFKLGKMWISDKSKNNMLLRQCMEFNKDTEFHMLRCVCEAFKQELTA